jgi:hypothetical protein
VDGLLAVASVCLVELAGRIRAADTVEVAPVGPAASVAESVAVAERPGVAGTAAVAGVGDRVAAILRERPHLTAADVAAELGIAARTARRHVAASRAAMASA